MKIEIGRFVHWEIIQSLPINLREKRKHGNVVVTPKEKSGEVRKGIRVYCYAKSLTIEIKINAFSPPFLQPPQLPVACIIVCAFMQG